MNWTKEHEQELELYIEDGLTYAQIAELLNEEFETARTAVAVSMKCFKLGLKSSSRKHTTEQYKLDIPDDIELLEEYEGAHTSILHRHSCGHKWLASPNSIKQGHGCPNCAGNAKHTTEQYKLEIPDDIELLEEYEGALTPIKHKCLVCTNEWKARPSSIKQGHGCPVCANKATPTTEQYNLDIPEGIELLGEYEGAHTPILHKHSCGYKWLASPHNIKQGSGCPACANKARPGYYGSLTKEQADALGYPLYLYNVKLHHGNETFFKIGLTKRNDKQRFKEYKPYTVTEVISFVELDAWTAVCKEKKLKLKCNYKPKHRFDGSRECYMES